MRLRVVHIVVLVSVKPAGRFSSDTFCDLNVTVGMVMVEIRSCDNHLRTITLEHVDFLLAHLVWNRRDATVTTGRRHHREPKARITRSALNQRATRL